MNNNKKVILVIILFIGISFIVYSFANPLTEEEDFTGVGGNTGISENNNSNDIIDNNDLLNNGDDTDGQEENKDSENENNSDETENNSSSAQIVQNKTTASSTTKPTYSSSTTKPTSSSSATKYYCKVVNGVYYGSAGNSVTKATFVSQCDSSSPTLKLTTKLDSPYTVMLGTSKKLSDFYSSSFGVLGGSVTCKNGSTVVTDLKELAAGTYTIICTATGGNGKNSGSISIPIRIRPVINASVSLGSFTRPNVVYLGQTVNNNVSLHQVGTEITLSGTMVPQPEKSPFNSSKYLTINFVGERKYTDEELAKAQFTVGNIKYTIDGRGGSYPITIGTTAAGKSYVSFEGNFSTGLKRTIKINWGDGNGDYAYNVYYNVTVLTFSEIEQSIKDQLGIVEPED